MNTIKISTLELSIPELMNIAQGLDLLHCKCIDNLHSIQSVDPQAQTLKEYFKEKQEQIKTQITEINKILNTPKNV